MAVQISGGHQQLGESDEVDGPSAEKCADTHRLLLMSLMIFRV